MQSTKWCAPLFAIVFASCGGGTIDRADSPDHSSTTASDDETVVVSNSALPGEWAAEVDEYVRLVKQFESDESVRERLLVQEGRVGEMLEMASEDDREQLVTRFHATAAAMELGSFPDFESDGVDFDPDEGSGRGSGEVEELGARRTYCCQCANGAGGPGDSCRMRNLPGVAHVRCVGRCLGSGGGNLSAGNCPPPNRPCWGN